MHRSTMAFDGSARTIPRARRMRPYLVSLSTSAPSVVEPNQRRGPGASPTKSTTGGASCWTTVIPDSADSTARFSQRKRWDSRNRSFIQPMAGGDQHARFQHGVPFPPLPLVSRRAALERRREQLEDGIVDPSTTKQIKTAWPLVGTSIISRQCSPCAAMSRRSTPAPRTLPSPRTRMSEAAFRFASGPRRSSIWKTAEWCATRHSFKTDYHSTGAQ